MKKFIRALGLATMLAALTVPAVSAAPPGHATPDGFANWGQYVSSLGSGVACHVSGNKAAFCEVD